MNIIFIFVSVFIVPLVVSIRPPPDIESATLLSYSILENPNSSFKV